MESLKGYEKITYPLNSARAKISAVCLSNLKGKRSWVTLTIMGKLKGKLTSVIIFLLKCVFRNAY